MNRNSGTLKVWKKKPAQLNQKKAKEVKQKDVHIIACQKKKWGMKIKKSDKGSTCGYFVEGKV